MSKIELGKTYRTRDGWEVRIYAVDGVGSGPVHGAYKSPHGWAASQWRADGCWYSDGDRSGADLIEVRPRIKRTVWLNVFPDQIGSPFAEKEAADCAGGDFRDAGHKMRRIACVKVDIDVEEGHGL